MNPQTPEIGKLNKRVGIYSRSDTPSGSFAINTDFTLVQEVWGGLLPASAGTYWNGKQTGQDVTHRISLRCIPGVTDADSITTELELEIEGMRYRPVRVTDLLGMKRFTVIDAVQLGRSA